MLLNEIDEMKRRIDALESKFEGLQGERALNLTIDETVKVSGFTKAFLRRAIQAKRIKAFHDRRWLVSRDSLEKFCAGNDADD